MWVPLTPLTCKEGNFLPWPHMEWCSSFLTLLAPETTCLWLHWKILHCPQPFCILCHMQYDPYWNVTVLQLIFLLWIYFCSCYIEIFLSYAYWSCLLTLWFIFTYINVLSRPSESVASISVFTPLIKSCSLNALWTYSKQIKICVENYIERLSLKPLTLCVRQFMSALLRTQWRFERSFNFLECSVSDHFCIR